MFGNRSNGQSASSSGTLGARIHSPVRAVASRTTLLAGILAVTIGATTPLGSLAATGSGGPTPYRSGTVDCTIDAQTDTIVIKPGTMGPATFYGTYRFWSQVDWTIDGTTWNYWYATDKQSSASNGNYASFFLNQSKSVYRAGRLWAIRVWQFFEWYDQYNRKIDATRHLLVDGYYDTTSYVTRPDACILK